MYSTIKRKPCKFDGCTRMPTLGADGYCYQHIPDEIKEKLGTRRDLQKKAKVMHNTKQLSNWARI